MPIFLKPDCKKVASKIVAMPTTIMDLLKVQLRTKYNYCSESSVLFTGLRTSGADPSTAKAPKRRASIITSCHFKRQSSFVVLSAPSSSFEALSGSKPLMLQSVVEEGRLLVDLFPFNVSCLCSRVVCLLFYFFGSSSFCVKFPFFDIIEKYEILKK